MSKLAVASTIHIELWRRHQVWTGHYYVRPSVLILESRRDVADALQDVITSAHYRAIVRAHIDHLDSLDDRPAAIVTRITSVGVGEPSYRAIEKLHGRPPVVAIAWADDEVAEAIRLKCEVVLRAPAEVGRLFEVLTKIVSGAGAGAG